MPKQRRHKKQVLNDLQTAKLVAGDDQQAVVATREQAEMNKQEIRAKQLGAGQSGIPTVEPAKPVEPEVQSLVVLVRVRGERDQQVILARNTEVSVETARLARDAAYPGRAATVELGGRIFRLGKPGKGYVNRAEAARIMQIS